MPPSNSSHLCKKLLLLGLLPGISSEAAFLASHRAAFSSTTLSLSSFCGVQEIPSPSFGLSLSLRQGIWSHPKDQSIIICARQGHRALTIKATDDNNTETIITSAAVRSPLLRLQKMKSFRQIDNSNQQPPWRHFFLRKFATLALAFAIFVASLTSFGSCQTNHIFRPCQAHAATTGGIKVSTVIATGELENDIKEALSRDSPSSSYVLETPSTNEMLSSSNQEKIRLSNQMSAALFLAVSAAAIRLGSYYLTKNKANADKYHQRKQSQQMAQEIIQKVHERRAQLLAYNDTNHNNIRPNRNDLDKVNMDVDFSTKKYQEGEPSLSSATEENSGIILDNGNEAIAKFTENQTFDEEIIIESEIEPPTIIKETQQFRRSAVQPKTADADVDVDGVVDNLEDTDIESSPPSTQQLTDSIEPPITESQHPMVQLFLNGGQGSTKASSAKQRTSSSTIANNKRSESQSTATQEESRKNDYSRFLPINNTLTGRGRSQPKLKPKSNVNELQLVQKTDELNIKFQAAMKAAKASNVPTSYRLSKGVRAVDQGQKQKELEEARHSRHLAQKRAEERWKIAKRNEWTHRQLLASRLEMSKKAQSDKGAKKMESTLRQMLESRMQRERKENFDKRSKDEEWSHRMLLATRLQLEIQERQRRQRYCRQTAAEQQKIVKGKNKDTRRKETRLQGSSIYEPTAEQTETSFTSTTTERIGELVSNSVKSRQEDFHRRLLVSRLQLEAKQEEIQKSSPAPSTSTSHADDVVTTASKADLGTLEAAEDHVSNLISQLKELNVILTNKCDSPEAKKDPTEWKHRQLLEARLQMETRNGDNAVNKFFDSEESFSEIFSDLAKELESAWSKNDTVVVGDKSTAADEMEEQAYIDSSDDGFNRTPPMASFQSKKASLPPRTTKKQVWAKDLVTAFSESISSVSASLQQIQLDFWHPGSGSSKDRKDSAVTIKKEKVDVPTNASTALQLAPTTGKPKKLIPITYSCIEFTSGALGALFGVSLGGPIACALFASMSNFLSKDYVRGGDAHIVMQSFALNTIQLINFVALIFHEFGIIILEHEDSDNEALPLSQATINRDDDVFQDAKRLLGVTSDINFAVISVLRDMTMDFHLTDKTCSLLDSFRKEMVAWLDSMKSYRQNDANNLDNSSLFYARFKSSDQYSFDKFDRG